MSTTVHIQSAEQFVNLITETVENQARAIREALGGEKEDLQGLSQISTDIHVTDQIQLRLVTGGQRFDLLRIETAKIAGFWSDGIVTGRIQLDPVCDSEPVVASLNTSSGGEELDGITEAEAYVNKGKAIALVAETLMLLERSEPAPDLFRNLKQAMRDLYSEFDRQQKAAAEAKKKALRESLHGNPDLIFMEDTDLLVDIAKGLAVTQEFGQPVVLAFHDGVTEEVSFEDPLSAVAFYNNSSANRKMTNQYIGKPSLIRSLEREPTAKTRKVTKIAQGDLKAYLASYGGVFVIKSMTHSDIIKAIS